MIIDAAWTWAKPAGQDLTGKLWCFAKLDSSGNIVLAGNGDAAVGVIHEEATSGNPASIQIGCVAKVKLGATLTPGARVQSDGNGNAIAAAGGTTLGCILEGGNSGEIVPVKFF